MQIPLKCKVKLLVLGYTRSIILCKFMSHFLEVMLKVRGPFSHSLPLPPVYLTPAAQYSQSTISALLWLTYYLCVPILSIHLASASQYI